jgi:hypothetical protein
MRRILYIVLMLLLPLQWSWASAASVCAHEEQSQAAHFGHHEHAYQGAAHDYTGDSQAGSLADHPDCGVCHGLASGVVPASDSGPKPSAHRTFYVPYASAVPDRFVETLLRPPLTLVS